MKKILLIEDELAYRRVLHDQLTMNGYRVIDAENGEKGLALARKGKPDMILLDIRMPKMDGLAVLGLLRKDDEVKETKVIMLTNLEPDKKILGEVMRGQPAYYYVKSDIQLRDLLEKIKEVLAE